MNYKIIGSSSKGNCIVIENMLMLDIGVSYTKIKPYLKNIKVIFVSHKHEDHLLPTTVKQIAYNYPTIKFVTSSDDVLLKLVELCIDKKKIWFLKPNMWYNLGILKMKTEMLYHDTSNFGLKWEYKGKKGIYLVDTSRIDHIKANGYNLYLVEANYKEDILDKNIRECLDKGMLHYLNRVPETHLSYKQANDFLIENMGDNSCFEYIHKSNFNFEEE